MTAHTHIQGPLQGPLQGASARASIRRHTRLGLGAVGLLVGGLGGWSVLTELSGAVLAPGTVVVDSHVKKVQHPTGGVVGEIRVRNGDRVRAGDVVVRLDETVAEANLAMVTKSLDELAARQARLTAERDGTGLTFPPALTDRRAGEPELAGLLSGEQRLFESRLEARAGQKAQLKERMAQLQEQIEGTHLQAGAKADEIKLIQDELAGVEQLWRKNLVPITRVTALKREETRLRGERGQLISTVAQAKGRISETALQILQIDQDLRSEVSKELREAQAKTAELVERKVAAQDQLRRIDLRAPQDGVVHQSVVHTVGGVINAGEAVMLIMPESDDLSIEVKVAPQDIDQLQPGLDTVLRLSAFNQRTTPELKGKVSLIAADQVLDERTGLGHYPVRIAFAEGERARLGEARLMPGMPVESFIQTGDRTVFSYLTKPLSDTIARAFREE
jgi:HlyD family secretion protein